MCFHSAEHEVHCAFLYTELQQLRNGLYLKDETEKCQ